MFDVLTGRGDSPSMHLIAAKQVLVGQMLGIDTGPFEKFENAIEQAALAVVTLHPIRLARHIRAPLKNHWL